MDYGILIREARESLGLYQRDLANENLSRNLLSNIEMNRVRLLPNKALYLYRRIIEVAWSKNIYYSLDFDEILETSVDYQLLKASNIICMMLHDMVKGARSFDKDYILNALAFASKNDVGYLRYYIYHFSSELLKNKISKGHYLRIQFEALDFLKWLNPKDMFEDYKQTLKSCTEVAYELGEFGALIHYYKMLADFYSGLGFDLDTKVLYNLSLFNQQQQTYDSALVYINEYLDHDLNEKDYIDGMILKAVLLTLNDQMEKGVEIYEQLLSKIPEDMSIERCVCLSNSIYVITKYQLAEGNLSTLIHDLDKLVEKQDNAFNKQSLLSSIGLGYAYFHDYDQAMSYFIKAFEAIDSDIGHVKLITLLKESYKTLKFKQELSHIVERVVKIPFNEVSGNIKEDYLKLLIFLQRDIYCHEAMRGKDDFINYMNISLMEEI